MSNTSDITASGGNFVSSHIYPPSFELNRRKGKKKKNKKKKTVACVLNTRELLPCAELLKKQSVDMMNGQTESCSGGSEWTIIKMNVCF